VYKFTYLDKVVTNTNRVQEYVKIHICNINTAFIQLYQSWNARKISNATKAKTFRRNIKFLHLYGCKIWKVVKRITQNLQTITNRHLRKMFMTFWSNVISNEVMWGHA
jgi:hypothetical protein